MKKIIILCLIFTFVYNVKNENATTGNTNSQSSVTDSSVLKKEISPLEKGASQLFSLTNGFLDNVQKEDFVIDSGDSPITFKTIQGYITNNTFSELSGRWQDLVKVFGGYAACVIVGLLFIIFMPIAGFLFCCCYCCCKKCGKSTEKEDPRGAGCKRKTYCLLLAVFATMLLAGGIVAIISNELLHVKLKNSDERGPVQYMKSGVSQLVTFASETSDDITTRTRSTVAATIDTIIQKVEDSARTTVDTVKKTINAEDLLNQTEHLGRSANLSLESLNTVASKLTELKDMTTTINDRIQDINQNISQTPLSKVQPDFKKLNKLTDVANNVSQTLNIAALSKQAEQEFDKVINEVDASINSTIDDARKQALEVQQQLYNATEQIDATIQPFVDTLQNTTKKEIDRIDGYLKDYADYIWYGGIGIPCLLIMIVVLYYMGILFGLCGQRPGYNAPCCNRGAGSNFLLAGVVWTYFFSWILMLLVMILFLTGGLMYTNLCRYLNDGVENVGKYEPILKDNFDIDLSSLLYPESTNTLSIEQALIDCKNNKGLYTAIHLQNAFDLDTALDVNTVLSEIDKIATKTFTVPNVDILTPSLKESLEDFANSGIASINFTSYETELEKVVVPNLTKTINLLRGQGQNDQADLIQNLNDTDLANFTMKMEELKQALQILKTHLNIQEEVNNLTASLNRSQIVFNTEGQMLVNQQLNDTVANITDYVNSTVESVKNEVKNDMGKCRLVYNAAQTLTDGLCVAVLDPFNTFWFGLGWGMFFLIPCIIFALLLANLYQKELPFDRDLYEAKKKSRQQPQDFDSPMIDTYQDNIPLTSQSGGGHQRASNGAINEGYHNYDRRDDYGRGNYYRDDYQQDRYRGGGGDRHDRYGERDYPPPSYHDSRHLPLAPQERYPVLPTNQRRY